MRYKKTTDCASLRWTFAGEFGLMSVNENRHLHHRPPRWRACRRAGGSVRARAHARMARRGDRVRTLQPPPLRLHPHVEARGMHILVRRAHEAAFAGGVQAASDRLHRPRRADARVAQELRRQRSRAPRKARLRGAVQAGLRLVRIRRMERTHYMERGAAARLRKADRQDR